MVYSLLLRSVSDATHIALAASESFLFSDRLIPIAVHF
jgi:hypothetical protein